MRSTWSTLALVVGLLGVSIANAQDSSSETHQLRQQIDALQRQLQKIESGNDANSRVTQLGVNRVSAREPEMMVRIYDLSDLFASAPPYPARYAATFGGSESFVFPEAPVAISGTGGMGGGLGGGGGGFFAVPEKVQLPAKGQQTLSQVNSTAAAAAEARTSVDDLIEAITSTISPSTWDEVGGPGTIRRVGRSLLISTDRNSHDQIDEMLSLFRKKWGTLRTISTRATWLWLTDDQLNKLLPTDGLQKFDDLHAFGLVDEAAWKKLLAEPAPLVADPRAGYRAIVTCYNGQTVSTVAGGQNMMVTNLEPTVVKIEGNEAKGQVAYRPQTAFIHDGAALQVTPMANTSGKFVVVDIHSRITKLRNRGNVALGNEKKAASDNLPDRQLAALDRPVVMTSDLATTLRVPVDRTMLVGGMTFESEPRPGEPNLYLFVKLSVQELRDDLPRDAARTPEGSAGQPADSKK